MDLKEHLAQNKEIQSNILSYIEDDENGDESFQNLERLINDKNIQNDKHDLSLLFHLVTKIGNNHHRNSQLFEKIEKILSIFLKDIKKNIFQIQRYSIFSKATKGFYYL